MSARASYHRTRTSAAWLLMAMLALVHSTSAQVGIEICGCQPAVYEITLDFSLSCEDGNITDSQVGIERSDCQVTGEDGTPLFGQEVIPSFFSLVQVIELDRGLNVVSERDYTSNTTALTDGAVLVYTSILLVEPEEIDEDTLPRGFQIIFEGQNVFGEFIRGQVILEYSNDCGIFPLLTAGQQDLYFRFTDLGDPPLAFCPIVPTDAPSPMPSFAPTDPMSPAPTTPGASPEPTVAPTTPAPTLAPTPQPTSTPGTPTESPSFFMSMETDAPSCPPSSGVPKGSKSSKGGKKDGSSSKSGKKQSGSSKSGKKQSGSSKGGKKSSSSSSGGKKNNSGSSKAGKKVEKRTSDYYGAGMMYQVHKNGHRFLAVGGSPSEAPVECPGDELTPVLPSRSSKSGKKQGKKQGSSSKSGKKQDGSSSKSGKKQSGSKSGKKQSGSSKAGKKLNLPSRSSKSGGSKKVGSKSGKKSSSSSKGGDFFMSVITSKSAKAGKKQGSSSSKSGKKSNGSSSSKGSKKVSGSSSSKGKKTSGKMFSAASHKHMDAREPYQALKGSGGRQ